MFAWLFHGKCVFLQKDFMAILCFLWHICAWRTRFVLGRGEISDKRIIFASSFLKENILKENILKENVMNEQIKLSPDLEARVHQAVENFMQGYGCCQSVVAAFADLYGLSDEMAKRIGAGFGGGVGRMRMMCGAVSGIVVLVGLDCGQTEGDDREGKSACYKVVQDLLAKSKKQNGSIICAEILGLKGHEKAQSSYVASARTAEYYKSRPCAAKVESAARIFAEYLQEKNNL